VPLAALVALDVQRNGSAPCSIPGTRLQHKFRAYWGVPESRVTALADAARTLRADAVIVSGLDALPYFPPLTGVARVWYAADEWVLHHVSQLKLGSASLADDVRQAVVKGLYERAHRRVIDRVWVVTDADRRAMRWIAGFAHVDVLPNGVDAEFYQPAVDAGPEGPDFGLTPYVGRTFRSGRSAPSAVFWGRLDFGPNIQALQWFLGRVWPIVRQRVPEASFTVIGFKPGDEVRALVRTPGVTLLSDLPDLRDAVRCHAVAVMPFVSGGGIKNKLLEAAAMGVPIVATPKATSGLVGDPPLSIARSPQQFADAIVALWQDATRRHEQAVAARRWVVGRHTWTAVARAAIAALEDTRAQQAGGPRR
jgi:glycosyltransferase involved in cell wall biosynthesis